MAANVLVCRRKQIGFWRLLKRQIRRCRSQKQAYRRKTRELVSWTGWLNAWKRYWELTAALRGDALVHGGNVTCYCSAAQWHTIAVCILVTAFIISVNAPGLPQRPCDEELLSSWWSLQGSIYLRNEPLFYRQNLKTIQCPFSVQGVLSLMK